MDASFLNPEIRCDFPVSEKRKKIWAVQLDMIQKLDEVCRTHNLTYYAANGTLLGAIRHGGFIPWDDDVDVVMPRKDYDRLISIAKDAFPHPYFLHGEEPNYYRNYLRLRNENTTAIPMKDFTHNCSKGIFIDIFPIDGCTDNALVQKLRYGQIAVLSEMADSYCYHGEHKRLKPVRQVLYLAAKFKGYPALLQQLHKVRSCTPVEAAKTVHTITHGNAPTVCPAEWYGAPRMVPFESLQLPIPAEAEKLLADIYGDYMTLPPIEKRGQKHTIFFDPDQPYSEYEGRLTREEAEQNLNNY